MCNNQTARWTNATWGQDVFSRVVLEDNAFVPDPTRPVIVEWIIIYHLPMISQIQTLM